MEANMTRRFKVGGHVTWNSEAGHVSGKIIKVHENVDDEVYIPTNKEDPRYENRERRPTVSRCSKGGCQKDLLSGLQRIVWRKYPPPYFNLYFTPARFHENPDLKNSLES